MSVDTATTRASAGFHVALATSLGLVLLLAIVQLWAPFSGDQALFMLIAKDLDGGGLLYRDVWDIKQPGIFYFFLAGGRLIGFTEAGIHAVEFLYLGGFAVILAIALRKRFRHPAVAGFLPAVMLGTYLTVPDSNVLSQVEGLIGPLLLASIALVRYGAVRGGRQALTFLGGVVGGLALLFKLIYAPILVVGWFATLHGIDGARGWRRLSGLVFPVLGATSVIALVLGIFALQGVLERAAWTWFVYPFEVLGIQPRPPNRLLRSAAGFGAWYLPALILGTYGLVRNERRDWLSLAMVGWMATGLGLVLVQKWWFYLFLVLVVPLSVLAADGLDSIVSTYRRGPARVGIAVILLASAAVPLFFAMTRASQWADSGTDSAGRIEYQIAVDEDVATAIEEASYIRRQNPGQILVFGDPRITLYADLEEASPFSGWSWSTWNDRVWTELVESLQMEPASHVFFSSGERESILESSPAFAHLVTESYEQARISSSGAWYERRDH